VVEPDAASRDYLIRVRLIDGAPLHLLLNLAICTDDGFRHPQGRRVSGETAGTSGLPLRGGGGGSGRDADRTLWR